MRKSLKGKVIVITGASSGFGRGAAIGFAKHGARLVLGARREQALADTVGDCVAAGGEAVAVPTDVGSADDIAALAAEAMQRYQRFDVWVNNAGGTAVGVFDETPLAEHEQVVRTDLLGTVYGSHEALRHFRAQGVGTLINVASMLGKIPAPYYSSYTAAKFGVVGLSASLRQELAEQKFGDVHVCTVLPMAMDTPFFEHAANYTDKRTEAIPPVDDAGKVVAAIVRLARRPRPEVHVGRFSRTFAASHNLLPGLTEKMQAVVTDWTQMRRGRPGRPRPGGLSRPAPHGTRLKDEELRRSH
ncbi:MAG: SDR family NAD(P)-dependent oxidoreductase [Gammaproteobacteria bacterium]|nr:SDR family NAD(P)-dependent oxidoreductase [Gammaproteobacteria bacterium]